MIITNIFLLLGYLQRISSAGSSQLFRYAGRGEVAELLVCSHLCSADKHPDASLVIFN